MVTTNWKQIVTRVNLWHCSFTFWCNSGHLPRRQLSTEGKSELWKDFLWRWGCPAEKARMTTFRETEVRCDGGPEVWFCLYSDVLPNCGWVSYLFLVQAKTSRPQGLLHIFLDLEMYSLVFWAPFFGSFGRCQKNVVAVNFKTISRLNRSKFSHKKHQVKGWSNDVKNWSNVKVTIKW